MKKVKIKQKRIIEAYGYLENYLNIIKDMDEAYEGEYFRVLKLLKKLELYTVRIKKGQQKQATPLQKSLSRLNSLEGVLGGGTHRL